MNVLRFSPRWYVGAVLTFGLAFFTLPLTSLAETAIPPLDKVEITATEEDETSPTVHSGTYEYQSLWYQAINGSFTWNVPEYVTAVAAEIGTSTDFEPLEVYDPPISSITFNDGMLEEGVQYFALQFKDDEGWGEITYHQIQIDRTAPEPFLIETSDEKGDVPTIIFTTTDNLSGIERYEVIVSDMPARHVTPMEAQSGVKLVDLEPGTHTVLVKAYDRAGNSTVSAKTITTSHGEGTGAATSTGGWTTGVNLLLAVLAMITLLELFYIFYLQRQSVQREALVRKEAREITAQMQKIFSALRDEIHDQIDSLNKRPRLSKKEKEVVGGLHKALEVSEQLIDKEVYDVTDILK